MSIEMSIRETRYISSISLKVIDESNDWLVGRIEEELVLDDDNLNWDDVALASRDENLVKLSSTAL